MHEQIQIDLMGCFLEAMREREAPPGRARLSGGSAPAAASALAARRAESDATPDLPTRASHSPAEWRAARLGKVTASRIADVVPRSRRGPAASRATYMAELIAERLTGRSRDGYCTRAMAWGLATEPHARAAYERQTNADVRLADFAPHPRIAMSGASPDGLVGDAGLLEIKCPNSATHLDTLAGRPIARKYQLQMQWQMACTGRLWCDFLSYDPRVPDQRRLFVTRIARDAPVVAGLERAVVIFLHELEESLRACRARRPQA